MKDKSQNKFVYAVKRNKDLDETKNILDKSLKLFSKELKINVKKNKIYDFKSWDS